MIFIVSIILMFSFALSAVFIGFAPNVYKLTDKDFMAKAIANADLEAMQSADVALRAKTIAAAKVSDTPKSPDNIRTMSRLFTYLIDNNGYTISAISITSNITVKQRQTSKTTTDRITVDSRKGV